MLELASVALRVLRQSFLPACALMVTVRQLQRLTRRIFHMLGDLSVNISLSACNLCIS